MGNRVLDLTAARAQLLREIEREVRETASYTGRTKLRTQVMDAIADVPREAFVPTDLRAFAYDNRPLPIGDGQTISQPYVVALMTDLLDPAADHVVLEIGTGSGYQAAVLSRLVRRVYTVEAIAPLSELAAAHLQRLGYDNIEMRVADGYQGWPEHAPYDGIIVTAAAPHVPAPLLEQLRPGGRMVIPVNAGWAQDLVVVTKDAAGKVTQESVLPVAFVPLTGPHTDMRN